MVNQLDVGDVVLCTVDRIVGTTVFVMIGDNNRTEGSIIVSEISPGRIRNLRDFVTPKKKIVCKIIRINQGNIELSLRRVTSKEKKEVIDNFKQDKRYQSILKTSVGDKAESIINKIKEKYELTEFISDAKTNPTLLNEFFKKDEAEKIVKILFKEKTKKLIVKKLIGLKSKKPNGLSLIKELFKDINKNIEVNYIAAGKYSLKLESLDLKKADQELQEVIRNIEKKSKKLGIEFGDKIKWN